jgi:deoxyribodipyrimidine photo-lyase
VHVVWFKRDLRVADHEALAAAAERGPVLALYVFEDELLAAPEADRGHYGFVLEALGALDAALRRLGARLTVRRGEMPQVLDALDRDLQPFGGIAQVYAHQECGNGLTYARDRRVARWLDERGVGLSEFVQDGVVRRLPSRDGWSGRWQRRMKRDLVPTPSRVLGVDPEGGRFDHGALPTLDELGLPPTTVRDDLRQRGGEALAQQTLRTFLFERGASYQRAMSSPLAGWEACSRLSPHFAVGSISLKTVHHELSARQRELREMSPAERGTWGAATRSFAGRLRWHCHFMQKLEDEPALEFRNLNRAFDGLREDDFDPARYEAWRQGRTGYPMVDACMRCLAETGWLNFRMRAMLVSFAAYHLWLHWRPVGMHLATKFVDFEPGIHWSQTQMQSGVTGINTVRIYSPTKQLQDQDPDGVFVRRWVPELARVPDKLLAEPFRMTRAEQGDAGCVIGGDYPAPIVDHKEAVQAAKDRVYAARRTDEAKAEAKRVYEQHGSRRRPRRRAGGATA